MNHCLFQYSYHSLNLFRSQHPKPFHSHFTTPHHTPHSQHYKHILYSNKQSSLLHLFTHHNTFYLSLHSNIIYQMSLYQIPPHHSLSPRKNHTSKRNPSIHCPSNHSFSRSNTNLSNNFNINHMKSTSSSLDQRIYNMRPYTLIHHSIILPIPWR